MFITIFKIRKLFIRYSSCFCWDILETHLVSIKFWKNSATLCAVEHTQTQNCLSVFEHFVAPKGLKQEKKTIIFWGETWQSIWNALLKGTFCMSLPKRAETLCTLSSYAHQEGEKYSNETRTLKETFLKNVGPNRSSLSGEFINYYEDVCICFCNFNVFIDNYKLWFREKGRYCIHMNIFSSARGSANYLWWWEESRKGEGGGGTGKDLSYINTCQICYEWSRGCRFGWGRYMACWV